MRRCDFCFRYEVELVECIVAWGLIAVPDWVILRERRFLFGDPDLVFLTQCDWTWAIEAKLSNVAAAVRQAESYEEANWRAVALPACIAERRREDIPRELGIVAVCSLGVEVTRWPALAHTRPVAPRKAKSWRAEFATRRGRRFVDAP